MKDAIQLLYKYILLILKETSAQFILVVGVITAFLPLVFPTFTLPNAYYLYFVLLAFFAANFQIWRRQQKEIITLTPKELVAAKPKSELDIQLVAGKEYEFVLDTFHKDTYIERKRQIEDQTKKLELLKNKEDDGLGFYKTALEDIVKQSVYLDKERFENPDAIIPHFNLYINTVIVNKGNIDLEIISSNILIENDELMVFPINSRLLDENHNTYGLTLPLSQGKSTKCVLNIRVYPIDNRNVAHFAHSLSKVKPRIADGKIAFTAISTDGDTLRVQKDIRVTTSHIKEIYIDHWKETGQTELLRLVGASAISAT